MVRALRSSVKRAISWESEPRLFWQRKLRAFFLRDLDSGIRYGPAVAPARHASRVLDVGSGPAGIAPFIGRRVIGVDLSFAGPRHDALRPVMASATMLPFGDGVFDLVLCFDVLEHVAASERPWVARELARVCGRRLLIAVPFGREASGADRRAMELHERAEGCRHRWLSEHLDRGLPDAAGVEAILAAIGHAPARRVAYTPLSLWWLARREEVLLRPDLILLRRFLLPPLLPLLRRLPARRPYRLLLDFDLSMRPAS